MFLPNRRSNEEWLGVVIAVPEPWNSVITQIRQSLGDPMALAVPPHITILPPLAVCASQKEAVFEHLAQVAARSMPFQISLDGSDSFLPTSPVSFLNIGKGAKHCTQLAEDVRSGPLDYNPRFPYHAHVTLAHGVSQELLDRALELGSDVHATWMVQGFRVDRVEEDGSYVSTAIFDFSSGLA